MAQQLGLCTAFVEDLNLIASTHNRWLKPPVTPAPGCNVSCVSTALTRAHGVQCLLNARQGTSVLHTFFYKIFFFLVFRDEENIICISKMGFTVTEEWVQISAFPVLFFPLYPLLMKGDFIRSFSRTARSWCLISALQILPCLQAKGNFFKKRRKCSQQGCHCTNAPEDSGAVTAPMHQRMTVGCHCTRGRQWGRHCTNAPEDCSAARWGR